MNLVADENVDRQIVERLRADGHSVLFVAELGPGISDETVLLTSRQLNAVLLTADKDFGELVFRQHLIHSGIILVRLAGFTPDEKAEKVAAVFHAYADLLPNRFTVVSAHSVRSRRPRP